MTQTEVNEQFKNIMQRIVTAKFNFNDGVKEYIERFSNINGELQDDYEGNITETEVEDVTGYVGDLADELQGIIDDLQTIIDEGINEEDEDKEDEEDNDINDIDDEQQSLGEPNAD